MAKSRLIYILLALFLGSLGIHNFYAGYTKHGIIKLVLTLCLSWLVVPAIAVFVWCIIEIIKVKADAAGTPFTN